MFKCSSFCFQTLISALGAEDKELPKSKDFKLNFKQVDVLDQTLEKEFLTGASCSKPPKNLTVTCPELE